MDIKVQKMCDDLGSEGAQREPQRGVGQHYPSAVHGRCACGGTWPCASLPDTPFSNTTPPKPEDETQRSPDLPDTMGGAPKTRDFLDWAWEQGLLTKTPAALRHMYERYCAELETFRAASTPAPHPVHIVGMGVHHPWGNCDQCSVPASPPSETREEFEKLSRRIIQKLTESAIGLAVCRHDLQSQDEIEQLPPEDLCDMLVRDVVNCMTGDDPGCLSDEELNDPERVDLPWLIRELGQAARASAPTQPGVTKNATPFHAVNGLCFQRVADGIRVTKEHRGFEDECYDPGTGGYRDWDEELATIPNEIWTTVVRLTAAPASSPAEPPEVAKLRHAATDLIERIEAVHNDPEYNAVWASAQLHRGKYYTGLTYTAQLAALREALRAASSPAAPVPAPEEPPRIAQFVVTMTGDGAFSRLAFDEEDMYGQVHGTICSCGKSATDCADEVTRTTLAEIADEENWVKDYPDYFPHIWEDHGETGTLRVTRLLTPVGRRSPPTERREE